MSNKFEKRFVFLGAPGAGKGTYAAVAEQRYGFIQISTGDILRDHVARETELGMTAKHYMDRGNLVPDVVMTGLIKDRLSRPDVTAGFILDGFPRTIPQAVTLETTLSEIGLPLNGVILLNVRKETVVERISNRLICKSCKSSFNRITKKPSREGICDVCGGPLIQRADDKEETVAIRYDTYMEKTAPLIDYYRDKGLLREIDADDSFADIPSLLADVIHAAPRPHGDDGS
jgi:adenylate kinase